MAINEIKYQSLVKELSAAQVTLVAVSKLKPVSDIQALYELGQRDFGENYVQELCAKQAELPNDVRWHFIGHLQSNKVKYIAPFVHLIHGVDSLKLLREIHKQGEKHGRVIDCLLQVHIASEETKFGFNEQEIRAALQQPEWKTWNHVRVRGLMGMASFTDNREQVRAEFRALRRLFEDLKATVTAPHPDFSILSMGMSGDYDIAMEEGSNLVRIGSLLFGERVYQKG